jgi:lactate dehydrogenase-like 2-hydroxyacid dehydrogenase
LQKLLESGVIEKLHQDTMKYEPRKAEIAVKSMELVDVVPIFSISTAGIFVAIFMIFLEQLFAWRLHRKHQNNVMTNLSFVEA